ncbi:hypothetical protein FQN57_004164 [Myotisia sp. PD_48]|nr:hypothetical protein FQN57_004164 [Myotisia sp. PD_48]
MGYFGAPPRWRLTGQVMSGSTSYVTTTPTYSSTLRTTPEGFPPTPQSVSHADVNVLSAHSSPASGFVVLDSAARLPAANLPLYPSHSPLQKSHGWEAQSNTSQCYIEYPMPRVSIYENLQIPSITTSEPFDIQSIRGDATVPTKFLDLASHGSEAKHMSSNQQPQQAFVDQNVPPSYRAGFHSRTPTPTRREAPGSVKHGEYPGNVSYRYDGSSSYTKPFREADGCLAPPTTPSSDQVNNDSKVCRMPLQPSNSKMYPPSSPRGLEGVSKAPRRGCRLVDGKYECEKCKKLFTRLSNCKSHMKIHDPDRKYPHQCTMGQCKKNFSRKTDLTRHVDSVHKKLRPFACELCDHRFARQDTLRRHREDGCRRQMRYRLQDESKQQQTNVQPPSRMLHDKQHQQQQDAPLPPTLDTAYPGTSQSYSQPMSRYLAQSRYPSGIMRSYVDSGSGDYHSFG